MPLLAATGIEKRFGGVVALRRADFFCDAGEIHALLGENGAGKSTMVKILCGVQPPDAGILTYDGAAARFDQPAAATAAGIIPVFQELSVVPDLTVAQNLFIGREPRSWLGLIDGRRMRQRASELLADLGFGGIDPRAAIRDLPLADRQLVEIAKAVGRRPKLLILDEATSALTQGQVRQVFSVVRRLAAEGVAVVYISHRMEEVQALCDRATVFRDGTDVGTIAIGEASEDEIVRMMIGRTLHEVFPARPSPRATPEPLLEVRSLGWGSALRDISLTLHRGEIVGLSGLEGQGQGDLLAALFGVYAGLRGDVRIAGRRVALSSPRDAMRAGIALVPEDRKTQGLILALPVRENVTLASPGRVSRGGLVAPDRERRAARQLADRLAIKAPDLDAPVRVLSGGNQQKVAIAKWLLRDAEVYLLADPTRGIDVGAKQEIYALIRGLADQGKGILYFSTDQTEIVGLCDRALVMYEGAIVRELSGVDLTEEQLVSAAVGLGRAPSEQRSTATLHESSGTAAGA